MAHFLNDNDVRRPLVFPRLAERYATPPLSAIWYAPSRRGSIGSKTVAADIRIVEISISGLMLEAPLNKKLRIGSRVRLRFNGTESLVEVRNLRPHDNPERNKEQIVGVSFFRSSAEFESLVGAIVFRLRQVFG